MKARIYKSTGSWYIAKADNGTIYNARIKGIFKIEGITSTNPIAVGDEVEMEIENEVENSAIIHSILDRKNYIARTSPHNKNQFHIVAANLDQTVLLATIKDPKTSQGFIDRFLLSAEAYHVPATIIFNKSDLFGDKEKDSFAELADMYQSIGYQVHLISLKMQTGLDDLKNILANKITLLSGHSGVGKSSFINYLYPEKNIKTQEVSGWSGKGMHTTTFAEMYDLPFGGQIIDTPGIREFGIVSDISKQEISHYFPEMRSLLQDCRYNNCMHINEPGCAIKEAVEKGNIHVNRYISYMNILDSIE